MDRVVAQLTEIRGRSTILLAFTAAEPATVCGVTIVTPQTGDLVTTTTSPALDETRDAIPNVSPSGHLAFTECLVNRWLPWIS
jgi:hypothetical protein